MEIKILGNNDVEDFKKLIEIFQVVFEHTIALPSENHLFEILSNKDFKVFVVIVNGHIIGGATVYILQNYYNKPVAYIYDLGISITYQNKGFGTALMQEVGNYCRDNNFMEAFVQAETNDIDAIRFYRKTNHTIEMQATQFIYSFNNS
ncbi:MAG: GNAT family N-acetyltransferase [Chitinophagaceae bacterium]